MGNMSLGRPLNFPERQVCSVYYDERQSISFPGESPYLVADFQHDLELKCVNPGSEVVSSGFRKCRNSEGIEPVMDTQKSPSEDLAVPAWTKSWKTEV